MPWGFGEALEDSSRSPTSCERPDTLFTRPTCTTARPSPTSTRSSATRRRLASGRFKSAVELAADGLPNELVYAGFSLGALPAQMLAQTRPGSKGALLFSAAFPASEFGGSWPPGVPLQIHMMEDDEWAAEDLPAARELAETIDGAELFLYPGDQHLFADNSLPDYDESAATLL